MVWTLDIRLIWWQGQWHKSDWWRGGWKWEHSERDRKRGGKIEMDKYLKYLNPLWSNKSDLMSTIYKIYTTPQLII
tara:strand:+ start:205 stop:432 length:228 start_codon:yes stop_codon:yes gene_type:complete